MAKLKPAPIEDNKPVRVTLELSAQVHRYLIAYGELLGAAGRSRRHRTRQAHRPHADALYGDRSRVPPVRGTPVARELRK